METNPRPIDPLRHVFQFELWTLGIVLAALLIGWTAYGSIYYHRILPYYDSLAYQQSFAEVVERAAEVGSAKTIVEIWHQPSNVVLFKFFAAAFGPLLPASKEGLYLYLFGIHFVGFATLIAAARGSSGMISPGLYAAAAWLTAGPFSVALDGVLDQRMDLASASFCLAVAALFFDWAKRPTRVRGLWAGLAAALAVLHRPVMAITIAGVAAIFFARALIRHRNRGSIWWSELGLILLPGLVLTLPWLVYHARYLNNYYLVWNVDVGSARSVAGAAAYNLRMFGRATGWIYPSMVGLALMWGIARRRVDWLDLGAVLLCLLLPLALLSASRSVGNMVVCQVPLGLLALALASVRPAESVGLKIGWLAAGFSSVALIWSGSRSLHGLGSQVAGVSQKPRAEAVQVLREIDAAAVSSKRVMTGFQSFPLDTVGLVALAREEGINLQAGRYFFHPADFGISNAAAQSVTEEELRSQVVKILRDLKGKSNLVLIAAAESEALMPQAHYSQTHTRTIRTTIEADPELVRICTTSPIRGVKFDVYGVVSSQ